MNKSIKLNKIFYYFLYLFALSPLWGYLLLNGFGIKLYLIEKIIFVIIGLYFSIVYKPKWNSYHYFLLIFFLYLFIWSFFNGQFDEKGLLTFYNSTALGLLFATLVLSNIRYSDKFIKITILILKVTAVVAFFVSVYQVINPDFLNANELWNSNSNYAIGDLYIDRRTSIFGYLDQNSLGLDFIPVFIILISYLFVAGKNKNILFFYYVLVGITSFLSNTRYIMVSYLISLVLVFIYNKRKLLNSFRSVVVVLALFIALLYSLSYMGYDFSTWYRERLLQEGSIEETTRYKAISNFLIMFPEKPIFGIGKETNDELLRLSHQVGSSRIHVGYLGFLVSWGLVGSFFLFGSWFLIAKMFYKNAKLTGYWGAFFGFIIFIWANVTFPKWHFFYYGLLFTFVFDKYYMDKYLQKTNKSSVN